VKKILALILLCVSSLSAQDLTDAITSNRIEWAEGTVLLSDGTELKGLIKYNDQLGILSYMNGDISKSFISRNVLGFDFFDAYQNTQRYFYSLPYEDEEDDVVKPLFFEVMKQFSSFAVLTRKAEVDYKRKTMSSGPGINSPSPTWSYTVNTLSQIETVYFMDADGTIEPYSMITTESRDYNEDILTLFRDKDGKTKNKLLNKDLLEKYTQEHYSTLMNYVAEKKLKLKRKSDLLKLLDYYELISKQ